MIHTLTKMNYPKVIKLANGLKLVKDHNIYEVFYKKQNIGHFICERFKTAIKEIVLNGFYDGKNYANRMQEVDNNDKIK